MARRKNLLHLLPHPWKPLPQPPRLLPNPQRLLLPTLLQPHLPPLTLLLQSLTLPRLLLTPLLRLLPALPLLP